MDYSGEEVKENTTKYSIYNLLSKMTCPIQTRSSRLNRVKEHTNGRSTSTHLDRPPFNLLPWDEHAPRPAWAVERLDAYGTQERPIDKHAPRIELTPQRAPKTVKPVHITEVYFPPIGKLFWVLNHIDPEVQKIFDAVQLDPHQLLETSGLSPP